MKNQKNDLKNAMAATIEGYLVFMSDSESTNAVHQFQAASNFLEKFRFDLASTKSCAPLCSKSFIVATIMDDRVKTGKTMADMRLIATALESYAVKNYSYPPASNMVDLKRFLEPDFIASVPQQDFWGNNYAFIRSAESLHYSIISGGSDSTFDRNTWEIAGTFQDFKEDIVFSDGVFKRYHIEAK